MKKIFPILAAVIIFTLLTTPVNASSPDLMARWHLNEGTTSTPDTSGNNLTGIVRGTDMVAGKFGGAFNFGSGGNIQVLNSSLLDPANLSIEAWVNASGNLGAYRYILSKGANSCVTASYGLYTTLTGGLAFYVSNGAGFILSPDAGTSIWDGNWHHVVGSFDGTTLRLYVDGTEIGSGNPAAITINYALTDNNDFYIGNYSPTCTEVHNFPGSIDEVRIWNRALTASEIAQHAKSNSVATE